jgi:hypothetical protein
MNLGVPPDVATFLDEWRVDPVNARQAFGDCLKFLISQDEVGLSFKARPGISHSLRARHAAQKRRELFVLVDVVDDEPENRWLSVCFYADMVTDPEGFGDEVPHGLSGEDALCLNLDEDDAAGRAYVLARLREAAAAAGTGAY